MAFGIRDQELYIAASSRERERERERESYAARKGIPIGNLTSQLFANVYMNEFDQFVKHMLHIKQYARYTDDFAIVSSDRLYLEQLIAPISTFLSNRLALALHPNKVFIRKLHQGVDFLGYVMFPNYRLVRAKTRQRMFKKFKIKVAAYHAGVISEAALEASLRSYLGVMSHANTKRLAGEMKNLVWFEDKD